MKPTWTILEKIFEYDGSSLRDFHVNETNLEDWQKLLDWLRASALELSYSLDRALPETAEEIFSLQHEDGEPIVSSLGVSTGECSFAFYFNGISDMEFDVSVRGLTTHEAIENVLDFMKGVARILQKPVNLTPEMSWKIVLLRYDPLTDELTFNPDNHERLNSI